MPMHLDDRPRRARPGFCPARAHCRPHTRRWRYPAVSQASSGRREGLAAIGQNLAMILSLTPAQQDIRDGVLKICTRFGDDYWLARDTDGHFPHDFHKALAEAGWLGIAMPEGYGGSG